MRLVYGFWGLFFSFALLSGCGQKNEDSPIAGQDTMADAETDIPVGEMPGEDSQQDDLADLRTQPDQSQPPDLAADLSGDSLVDTAADSAAELVPEDLKPDDAEPVDHKPEDLIPEDLPPEIEADLEPEVVPECTEQQVEPCFEGDEALKGVGVCVLGQKVCAAGVWGQCEGYGAPGDEVCDKQDNDCDGSVDELGQEECGIGPCAVTVQVCVEGQLQTCVPLPGDAQETCNGIDDTCDGVVDETCDCLVGETQECFSGAPNTLGVGPCKAGMQTCVEGFWAECVDEVVPRFEACDGLDNNCNGVEDDGNPGVGFACDTGLMGVCAAGTTVCSSGEVECKQNVDAGPEVCDGLDNNCNGSVDEGNPEGGAPCQTGLLGVCETGALWCSSGTLLCVQDVVAGPEVCDGLDNNCDGIRDEDNPGGGSSCDTGMLGVCAAGTTACSWGMPICVQNVLASPEDCDGLDNNCNGIVDEGNPGGGALCTLPLPGECASGVIACTNGTLGCAALTAGIPELCDGLDNDCDGVIDEDAPGLFTLFFEDFSDNSAGWWLGQEWSIGPAVASQPGALPGGDPSADHTPTSDNGIAGVVIGGDYLIVYHNYFYLTSPILNASAVSALRLEFWRWLVTDYPPYVRSVVEVSVDGGANWTPIWAHADAPFIVDNAWNLQSLDLSSYNSPTLRIRFGFKVDSMEALAAGGWNLDDIEIRGCM